MKTNKTISSLKDLEALFDSPNERALNKELDHLDTNYRKLVEASPFCVMSTVGPHGIDCSPRGDSPGFVRVVDERTLVIPERPGNNRLDSLRNLLGDPKIGLIFMIPGKGETLRICGQASISNDPALLEPHRVVGKLPLVAIVIQIERVMFQCARSIMRAKLWSGKPSPSLNTLPTAGQMLADKIDGFDATEYDDGLDGRLREALY